MLLQQVLVVAANHLPLKENSQLSSGFCSTYTRVKQFIKADRNKVRAGQASSKHSLPENSVLGLWGNGGQGLRATSNLEWLSDVGWP